MTSMPSTTPPWIAPHAKASPGNSTRSIESPIPRWLGAHSNYDGTPGLKREACKDHTANGQASHITIVGLRSNALELTGKVATPQHGV